MAVAVVIDQPVLAALDHDPWASRSARMTAALAADRTVGAGEGVGLHFNPPGEPWRNGYIESFNSRARDECLNINILWALAYARVVIADRKVDYNHRRRHSALGYQAPAQHAINCIHR